MLPPLPLFLEHGSCGWFMGGNDLRLNYPPFNNSYSASYSELYSISHLVPCAPKIFPLHFNVLTPSLTLRLTLKEKWTFIDASYGPDTAPAINTAYPCEINSSLKKVLFLCPLPTCPFIMRNRGSEMLRNLPVAAYRGKCELGWPKSPLRFPLFWEKPPIFGDGSKDLILVRPSESFPGSFATGTGERELIFPWWVK